MFLFESKIRISILYYTHALPCKTAQNETFFSFLSRQRSYLNTVLHASASNQTDDGKPKGMHAVKNHYTPFETKKESMKKIQRNESKEFNKRPNEVPKLIII